MRHLKLSTLAIVLGSIGLTGCSNLSKSIDKDMAEGETKVKSMYASAAEKVAPAKFNFKQSNDIYINPTPLPTYIKKKKTLPNMFQNKIEVTMPRPIPVNEVLSELSSEFYKIYNEPINFDVSLDVYNPNAGIGQVISHSEGGSNGNSNSNSNNSNSQTVNGLSAAQINNVLIDSFVYEGTLEAALNQISQKTGISWEWDGNIIKFYRHKTDTYYISALAGKSTSTSTISTTTSTESENESEAGSSSGSSGSTTGQTLKTETNLDQVQEITTYLRSMLSPTGRISIMQSTGMVTIKDTPLVHEQIDKAINQLNAVLSKQIHVNLEIYEIQLNEADDFSFDWNVMWTAASSKYNFTYKSLTNTTATSNASSIGIVDGKFNGSNVLFGLNSSLGRIVNSTAASVVTQNGKVSPIVMAETTEYIRSVTTNTQSGSDNMSYTATPAVGTTGLDAKVLARIQPDGRILLKFNINMSELKNLRPYTIGTGANATNLQLADASTKSFEQEITLRSSNTLVLSGIKQSKINKNNNGVGNPYNMLAGGASKKGNKVNELVIVATPYIVDIDN